MFTIVLQKANLRDAPDFNALSYAWGDRDQSTLVSAAGGPTSIEVAPNLRSMTNHIWSSSPERAIWIDALCINQQNITERTQQVPLLTKIFALASKVLIWLGDKDGTSPLAFTLPETCA
jgi:hypothetical protein